VSVRVWNWNGLIPGNLSNHTVFTMRSVANGERIAMRRGVIYHDRLAETILCAQALHCFAYFFNHGSLMSIPIKTPEEIEKMRVAGRLAAEVLEMIAPYVEPGITTNELDRICHDYMTRIQGVIAAPLNYRGFPKSICTSVNHQVCHGIPNDKALKKGDIVNVDITVIKDGFHGDTSQMFCVGAVPPATQRLVNVTREALFRGIAQVRPGATLGDIGQAIQTFAEAQYFSVVREYCGHGIGRQFHELPHVLHYGRAGTGIVLQAGMCFTIEPMINAGKRYVKSLADGWTVVTKDHSLSAQWEHTLVVTPDGYEILTLRQEEREQSHPGIQAG
jgi:methionyl aminopeptidase